MIIKIYLEQNIACEGMNQINGKTYLVLQSLGNSIILIIIKIILYMLHFR